MAFTYFFRDLHTLEHAARHIVPYTAGKSNVKIWDAGCAMGPEPYSLAIVLSEKMGRFAFKNVKIEATDIDGSDLFGNIIDNGVYTYDELKRIPANIFQKYFAPVPEQAGCFRIEEGIKNRLSFRKHDLLSLQPAGDDYSLILCKNVLLHFQPEERAQVIRMFHKALAPGGYFATEQTQKLPPEVEPLFEQVTSDAQLFRKKEVSS